MNDHNVRLRLLSDISSELLLSTNPRDILCHVFRRLSAHLGLEVYFHYLVDEERGGLRLNSCGGVAAEQVAGVAQLDFGQALCGTVASRGERMIVESLQQSDDPRAEMLRRIGIDAYVCHPLIAQGQMLGTLSFGTSLRSSFSDDELELLRTVSNQIAIALERGRMIEELERRANDHARAKAQSEANLAQLEAVVSSMSEGVVITDLRGEPVMLNPAALDLLGFESLEHCRRYFGTCNRIYEAEYMDHVSVPSEEWPVQRIARGESFSDVEVGVRHRDTGRSWIGSFSGRPVRTSSGEIVLAAITMRDITERKMSERELKEAKEAAEAANRAKDHFLATLSHELRTPLTPVLTLVQALESEMRLPAEFLPFIEIIRRNVETEVLLIDDLLDLTRIARGKFQFTMVDADIHDILRHVLEIYRSDIEAKGLMVRFEPNAVATSIRGDTARLQQVFWNLVKNAVKFTEPGGTITISTCNIDSDWIRVEVVDTGIGIERGVLPHIFEAFEQGGAGTTARYGGLGLGLAISKAIVDQHNGVIKAESEGVGRGSRFQVTLATSTAGGRGMAPEIAAASPCSQRGSALVVLPDATDAAVLRNLLEDEGYIVQTAAGVRGAMQMTSSARFDLLLCGSRLPDGSGVDLIRNLNAVGPVRGILLVEDGADEIERGLAAGYSASLNIPVDPDRLRETIGRLASS